MADDFFRSVDLSRLTLRVADLARVQAFYEDVLGFAHAFAHPGVVEFRAPGTSQPLIVLEADPAALPRPRATAGLFHVALLYPDRTSLARALLRVLELGIPIGSADHGVSEAIYLSDPEGNGLELYADRAREDWPASNDDQVEMYTNALDLPSLLALARPPADRWQLPADVRIGHVHLSVADLIGAERFYGDILGFTVTQRSYPGALFLARDGYHHHLGANTWRSHLPAVPGALGLVEFTMNLSSGADFAAVADRLSREGRRKSKGSAEGLLAQDFDGLAIRLLGAV